MNINNLIKQTNAYVDTSGRWININDITKLVEASSLDAVKDCRDMFIVGSVSWNLLNDVLDAKIEIAQSGEIS